MRFDCRWRGGDPCRYLRVGVELAAEFSTRVGQTFLSGRRMPDRNVWPKNFLRVGVELAAEFSTACGPDILVWPTMPDRNVWPTLVAVCARARRATHPASEILFPARRSRRADRRRRA